MQQARSAAQTLLSARQVQDLLQVDRSTVYRMAEDGRLPAIKVGKQWRFPADAILALLPEQGAHLSSSAAAVELPGVAPPDQRGVALRQEGTPGPAPGDTPRPALAGLRAGAQEAQLPHGQADPQPPEPRVAQAAIDVAAPLLGVMMVVTDIDGAPITAIANPCPWFAEHSDDPEVVAACLAEWRDLASLDDLQPRFGPSAAGFECARAFIRSGAALVGMVLAGGVNPPGSPEPGRYDLDAGQRERVLAALPRIAASLIRPAPIPLGAKGEKP